MCRPSIVEPPRFIFRDVIVNFLQLEEPSQTAIRCVPLAVDPAEGSEDGKGSEEPPLGKGEACDVITFYNSRFVPQMHSAILRLVFGGENADVE